MQNEPHLFLYRAQLTNVNIKDIIVLIPYIQPI